MTARWLLAPAVALLAMAAGIFAGGRDVSTVDAATGDLVGSVTFSVDCTSGLGVGIAFDGTNLWYTCYAQTTDLYKANATTGAVIASYSVKGGLGAIAWDSVRGMLWAGAGCAPGQTGAEVYLIDPANPAGTTVPQFSIPAFSGSCLNDGLAYDGVNKTIYHSWDGATNIRHVLADPPFTLQSDDNFVWNGSGCYNSGLAIGGTLLFEGSNGCTRVWVVDKVSKAAAFNFSTVVAGDPNFRDEDLECDNVTYTSIGKEVMWSKEAYNPQRAHAFEIPSGTCGSGGQPANDPTIANPGVDKSPEGNPANTGPGPAANLWICQLAPCAGPGEGNLLVFEKAFNVQSDYDADGVPDVNETDICTNFGPDGVANMPLPTPDDSQCLGLGPNIELGLGAYEFSVEYDNFVIESVNPCDIVFGTNGAQPDGAGANRGPVDEVDSSGASGNPFCLDDAGAISNNGTCANSIILENIIHFGCVTNGPTPYGPDGDFDLAALNLIPHEDLSNDIFPGNNNGVLTVIKDNGCELVDIFGHPVLNSINGGLTPTCGDLAVTVRILEGDLDLDCDVDVIDEQLIAFRYGAFFGGLLYSKWFDLEPELHDLDIDIKDIQKVFGRDGSTCQAPIPAQPPLPPPTPFG